MKLALSILLCSMLTALAPQTFSGATLKGMSSSPVAAGNDPVFNSVTHVYHMEQASGNPRLDSVGGVSLTESAPIGQVAGKHNNAAHSTGCNELDSAGLSEASSFSYAMWLNLDSFDDTSPLILTKTSGSTSFTLTFYAGDLGSHLTTASYHTLTGPDVIIDITALSIPVNQWFFVVITFNGSTGVSGMSINGNTFTTSTGSPYSPGAGALAIVDSVNCNDFAIDELMMWPIVLTQGNVTTLYAASAGTFYSP